jgi:hypothetical protein
MVQILAERQNSRARLRRAERENERQLRAALIRVGGYLGLDERILLRFSETISGRAWSRCGAAQVVEIGKCLLDIAVALKCEHQPPVAATDRPRPIGVPGPMAAAINGSQLSRPVDSNRRPRR